jgi:hypothetical protein
LIKAFKIILMKKILLLFTWLIIGKSLWAQPIISNTYFPSVGDSLKFGVANNATTSFLRIGAAGGNQTWRFNFLRSAVPTQATYTEGYAAPDSATLAAFPSADLVRNLTNNGQKEVYNKTATRFELLGYQGFNLGGLTLPVRAYFNQPVLERRAPLVFNTTNNNASSYVIAFSGDLIPDTIWANLRIRPDSVRIRFQTTRSDKTDAWGQLLIPGGTYEVLRERRFEVTETKIETKVGNLFWLDFTTIFLQGNRPPKDTTLSYYFWSNTAKEPIAMVQFRNETDTIPSRVEYKYLAINTSTSEKEDPSVSPTIFPNPSHETLFVKINSSESKIYQFSIINTFGQIVSQQKQMLGGGQVLELPISTLPAGVYFLSINSEQNKPLSRQKFVKY